MAKGICSAPEGCPNRLTANDSRSLCPKHYQRWRTTGTTYLPEPLSDAERFWAKVNKNGSLPPWRPALGPCWEWTAGRVQRKYGVFCPTDPSNMAQRAHRWAWVHLIGPIPEELEIDHLCRNPGCVKAIEDENGPPHLEAVSHAENVRRTPDNGFGRNASKTHCKHGHEFSVENTLRLRGGGRQCRACNRERSLRFRLKWGV